ncbi:hypothetical protein Spb1_19360 [Planctopirus ephydatiae]|uniref:Inner membrane protein n=1 Tax=Planctopirus ephydatiae TaxID=2528019 RepID=A0A518GN94_9PLAN|nr:metal-dependent hydrolase [Planctopirus ephydatiae]QDV30009.1 hypothetical protein Spb1_19360 [Planctopirus ephydatiae]
MAGFQTHIGVAAAVGTGYAYWGYYTLQMPVPTCLLAGGFVTIAGMMPDLDSDSGIPARETITFAAAIIPMILMNRLISSGLSAEQLVLVGIPLYLFIRFAIGTLLKRFTIHRGMFHSIPAIAIAGMIGFLICDADMHGARIYKTIAVMLGYTTHLVLDEIWSVNLNGAVPTLKKSFGTALKFFSNDPTATSATYGMLLLLGLFVLRDASPEVKQRMAGFVPSISAFATNETNQKSAAIPPRNSPQSRSSRETSPTIEQPPERDWARTPSRSTGNQPIDPWSQSAPVPPSQRWTPPRDPTKSRGSDTWSEVRKSDEFAPDHFSNGWR